MPIETPVLRPLTGDDLGPVARIHCDAFASSGLTCFGEVLVREYYEWQMTRLPDLTGFVAVMGDRVAGYAFCGDTFLSPAIFLARRPAEAVKAMLRRPSRLLDRRMLKMAAYLLRPAARTFSKAGKSVPQPLPIAQKAFWVEAVAVEQSAQGQGIGGRLTRRCAQYGFSLGFSDLYLAVETTNRPAIAMYERLGWTRVIKNGTWNGRMKLSARRASVLGSGC